MTTKAKPSILDQVRSLLTGARMDELEEVEDLLDEAMDVIEEGEGDDGEERSEETREGDEMDDEGDEEMERSEEAGGERADTPLARAERRRQERKDRRSQRYAERNIISNPVMTLARDGEEGLNVGNLVRVQINRSAFSRQASRELEWMERSEYMPHDLEAVATVPFEFMSRYAPMSRPANQERQAALRQTPSERVRAAITTAAGVGYGTIATNVDVQNSLAWLYDRAPVLEKFTVMPGARGEWKWFYGSNAAANIPTPGEVAQGGAIPESSPRLAEMVRLPVTIASQFPISSALLAANSIGLEGVVLGGAENLVSERLVRNVLSGPNVGPAFADDGGSNLSMQDGLINGGIPNTNYGADADAFTRDDVVTVEQNLRAQNPEGSGLVWIVSTGFEGLARTKRIGGNESVRFVAERNSGSLFEGIMNPNPGGMGISYVSSTHLGKASVVNPGILVMGSQVVVVIWGSGVDIIPFVDPRIAGTVYGFRTHANVCVVNGRNGHQTRQGA